MIKDWMTEENRVPKTKFDLYCNYDGFMDGPHVSSFGDGMGEPYNPNREAWGTLKDGTKVWAWVHGPNSEEEENSG